MIVVFGGVTIDFVFPVQRLPGTGDTVESGESRMQPGGKGANQAVAAARDGARVSLIGAVGDDVLADAALAGLKAEGIDVSGIRRAPGPTGRSALLVMPEGRTVVAVDPGATRAARADQVNDRLLRPGHVLLLQMEAEPRENEQLIARARARGMRIVLNLSPPRVMEASALRAVDLLIGNSIEMAWLGEQIGTANNPASIHAALGVPAVRMSGVQGADAMTAEGYVRMPAYPVDMRDTTAAADCFVGVLAAAWAGGANLSQAIRRAAVAAALSTTRLGAQDSMPGRRETEAALRRAPRPSSEQPEVPD